MRRIAVSRVYIIADENNAAPQSSGVLSSGEIVEQCANMCGHKQTTCRIVESYRNHVADVDEDMNVLNHFPLTEEIAMTEWLGGTLVIRGGKGTLYPTILTPPELCADDGGGNGDIQ